MREWLSASVLNVVGIKHLSTRTRPSWKFIFPIEPPGIGRDAQIIAVDFNKEGFSEELEGAVEKFVNRKSLFGSRVKVLIDGGMVTVTGPRVGIFISAGVPMIKLRTHSINLKPLPYSGSSCGM
jgi:hypothetical protein